MSCDLGPLAAAVEQTALPRHGAAMAHSDDPAKHVAAMAARASRLLDAASSLDPRHALRR